MFSLLGTFLAIANKWHSGSGACTAASQQEGHEFDPRMGRCWLRGAQGVSSTKNPNRKTCKKNRMLLSVSDRDGRFTWSPGAEKLPTAPGVLEEGQSGMGKSRD